MEELRQKIDELQNQINELKDSYDLTYLVNLFNEIKIQHSDGTNNTITSNSYFQSLQLQESPMIKYSVTENTLTIEHQKLENSQNKNLYTYELILNSDGDIVLQGTPIATIDEYGHLMAPKDTQITISKISLSSLGSLSIVGGEGENTGTIIFNQENSTKKEEAE